MRDKSAVPRDSRELAVRNQFFTPRYVVEFLTDNTLGRTWYEMTKRETSLAESCRFLVHRPKEILLGERENAPVPATEQDENLSQEELLKQPVFVPHRAIKDPREILMLDPACGSMHFGLYAFDLFLKIYEEAWDVEEKNGPQFLKRSTEPRSLHDIYESDKERFLLDVPRLIIENNIHGIDIDLRAVQIAGLSLWLRAHKAWSDQGVHVAERPHIERSNIVCAEPMPGEVEILEDFLREHLSATPEKRLIGEFVRSIFDSMRLAGEAGPLLKIEEEAATLVEGARDEWRRLREQESKESYLFEGARTNVQTGLNFDIADITDENLWEEAEAEIYDALETYAEQAENGGGFQRRLFTADAAQGFAFIELCRKRYDVVVMNPPFGELSRSSKSYVESTYPNSKGNILAHFLERAGELCHANSRVGAIISRTCFYLTTLEKFRLSVLAKEMTAELLADLGDGVLDAVVETAAATFHVPSNEKSSVFLRLLTSQRKDNDLLKLCDCYSSGEPSQDIFEMPSTSFLALDGAPYVYWINAKIIKLIAKHETLGENSQIRVGLQTGNDERFLRLWSEIPVTSIVSGSQETEYQFQSSCVQQTFEGKSWAWYSKIDESSPFAASMHLVVNWASNGAEIKAAHQMNGDAISRYVRSEDSYFRPGISYMLRSYRLIPYFVPKGCIPTAGRSQIFPKEGMEQWVLALVSSNIASAVARFRGEKFAWPVFQNSMVGAVPYIEPTDDLLLDAASRLRNAIKDQQKNFRELEQNVEFIGVGEFDDVVHSVGRFSLLGDDLDHRIGTLFGFDELDISILERDLFDSARNIGHENHGEEIPSAVSEGNRSEYFARWLSYCLGVVFGRWDLRVACIDRSVRELPDPFAPLSICSPGMLQNGEGLPAEPNDVPADYPIDIVWNGILVDDAGHPSDIENHIRKVLQEIWKERSEAIETEACEILGVRSIRDYFRKPSGFFADHLKRYSKSRRQAPIYLPLSTTSGGYSLWLYYHRLTDQTLYTCVNDFVEPKLRQVKEDANNLRSRTGRTRDDEKRLEECEKLLVELEEMRDEILRLAPIWKPNLNDGVQITLSPLWKLFRLSKWRTILEDTWKKLEKGDYDWAHLAYSFFPERVREKCRHDKSLAIAHDLEDLYEERPAKTRKARTKQAQTASLPLAEG